MLLIHTGQMKYFEIFRSYTTSKKVNKIINRITSSNKPSTRRLACKILLNEMKTDKVADLLIQWDSPQLLIYLDKDLFTHNKETACDIYLKTLHAYLNTHVGLPAAEKTKTIIDHLVRNQRKNILMAIKSLISKEFSERHSLKKLLPRIH